ncbi:Pentatricopeptide repeat [Dillenia turbinata]|uniref:Pentatricopeptide repeat n=1 Tax=Dillenia turbinata TaxID=194707 RepID=A0AAN8VEY8_9MAGN
MEEKNEGKCKKPHLYKVLWDPTSTRLVERYEWAVMAPDGMALASFFWLAFPHVARKSGPESKAFLVQFVSSDFPNVSRFLTFEILLSSHVSCDSLLTMKKILKLSPSNSSSLFLPLNSFSSSSSSSSSQIHLIKPQIQKSFFKSNPEENKFRETIATLCQQNRLGEAIQLLDNVNQLPASTYSTLLQLCLQRKSLLDGKMVHAHIKNSDFKPGIFISNRIIDMYVKCDSLVHARQVFDEMVERDLCSWNTIINGYAKAGKIEEARKLFNEMPEKDSFSWTAMVSCYVKHDMAKEGLELFRSMQRNGNGKCSKFTVSSVLAASSAMQCLRFGKEIHGHIVRSGLDSDAVVWSALSDMYGKCGSLDEARRVFDRTLERDVVSWTAMIDRYFEDGRKEEGLTLFSDLLRSGIRPNEFTFAGVLNTCADHAVENFGREVHAHMVRLGFDPVSFAASALVHMYSKCGNVECAKRVFNGMPKPDLVSWTSLIAGYDVMISYEWAKVDIMVDRVEKPQKAWSRNDLLGNWCLIQTSLLPCFDTSLQQALTSILLCPQLAFL